MSRRVGRCWRVGVRRQWRVGSGCCAPRQRWVWSGSFGVGGRAPPQFGAGPTGRSVRPTPHDHEADPPQLRRMPFASAGGRPPLPAAAARPRRCPRPPLPAAAARRSRHANLAPGRLPARPRSRFSCTDSALIANLSTKTVILRGTTVRGAAARGRRPTPDARRESGSQIGRLPTKIANFGEKVEPSRLFHR